jgi:hypothetical protein
MRTLLAVPMAIAIIFATSGAANAADEVVCGVSFGFSLATATAPGSTTLGQNPPPGYVGAQPSVTIVIPLGSPVTRPDLRGDATGYLCIRTSTSGSTRTFVAVVPPGSAGYLPRPAAGPPSGPVPGGRGAVGVLPSTSTAPSSVPLVPLALSLSGLLALGAYALRRRRHAFR